MLPSMGAMSNSTKLNSGCLQYGVVKKLRNEVLVLKGEIDALQRMQQENMLSAQLETQQSV